MKLNISYAKNELNGNINLLHKQTRRRQNLKHK
jgi:hypothetical protein